MADEMHEILRALGRIEGKIEKLEADIDDGKDSRGRIHTKLERIVEDVHIVGQTAAQARDIANAVTDLVTKDVKPVTDDIKRIRLMGVGFSVAVGLVAGALGIGIATWGAAVLDWLKTLGKH